MKSKRAFYGGKKHAKKKTVAELFLETYKEIKLFEEDLRQEAGFDDQEVKDIHDISDQMKMLFIKHGHIKEQTEYLEANLCKKPSHIK